LLNILRRIWSFLSNFFNSKIVFLSVATDLTTSSSPNVLFDQTPIFAKSLQTLNKSIVLIFSPSPILWLISTLFWSPLGSLKIWNLFGALLVTLLRHILEIVRLDFKNVVFSKILSILGVGLRTFKIYGYLCRIPGYCAP